MCKKDCCFPAKWTYMELILFQPNTSSHPMCVHKRTHTHSHITAINAAFIAIYRHGILSPWDLSSFLCWFDTQWDTENEWPWGTQEAFSIHWPNDAVEFSHYTEQAFFHCSHYIKGLIIIVQLESNLIKE